MILQQVKTVELFITYLTVVFVTDGGVPVTSAFTAKLYILLASKLATVQEVAGGVGGHVVEPAGTTSSAANQGTVP